MVLAMAAIGMIRVKLMIIEQGISIFLLGYIGVASSLVWEDTTLTTPQL